MSQAIRHSIDRIMVSDQQFTPFKPKRWLRVCLCLVAAASAVTCIVMPALGVRDFFDEFRVPYSVAVHARILAEQCVGPVYTLMVVLPCAALSLIGKKRIPWWSWLLGMVGPIYTVFTSQTISHEFSHTLFQECSGIYGEWIQGICVAGGLALAVLVGLEFNVRLTPRAGAAPVGEILKTALPIQLATTSRGDRFLRLWIPAGAVLLGLVALATGCYTEFRTPMVGTPMMLYGAASIAVGLATFGLPVMGDVQQLAKLRLRGGLALSAAFLIALALSMV